MVIAIAVAVLAAVAWIVVSLVAGIGLGRMIARCESEDGRVPSLISRAAENTIASF